MTARSYLFVPADRRDMLAKAHGRGADALIIDLEDAVAASAKVTARKTVLEWLESGVPPLPGGMWVRVNNDPDLLQQDLEVIRTDGVAGIFLPKVEALEQLQRLRNAVRGAHPLSVVAMIESAAGLLASREIAESKLAGRLALGEVDLAADLGMQGAREDDFLPIRLQLITASAAAGLPPPIGPVFPDFADEVGLHRSTETLRRLGIRSRPAIHPVQIGVINAAFTPSPEEVDAARRLVELFDRSISEGRGVCVDDQGRMVDEAVVRSARRTLEASMLAG